MDRMMKTSRDRWNALAVGILLAAGVAALALILLSGCGATPVAGAGAPGTTPGKPTATRTPDGSTVHWQTAPGWPGVKTLQGGVGDLPPISPSDGNSMYVCVGSGTKQEPGNLHVWATHNLAAPKGGAQWTSLTDLPIALNQTNGCTIVVDTTDPSTFVAMTPLSGQQFGEVSFASFDGGQTWQQLGQHPVLFQGGVIATYQGKIYGIVAMSYAQEYVNPNPSALRVSSDQMRTWQTLPSGNLFDAFWLNPGNGELLAHEFNSGQFVTSDDGGQTWQVFANAHSFGIDMAGSEKGTVVQAPVAGQPWMVCGVTGPQAPSVGQPAISTAVCTNDMGQTYTTLPNLPDAPAGTSNQAGDMRLIGITPDGTVLAMLSIDAVPQNGPVPTIGYKLWRLPRGATQWQSLGVPPQFEMSYAPGALFAWPANGVTMGPCASCGDYSQALDDYVAAYP